MRLRDCTPYVSCSQGNRHRFIFKLEEIIWWLAGNNVTFTSQVALMVWWRNNKRSLKKIYDTGIGIGSPSGRSQWVIWNKKNNTWPVWTSQSQKWKAHDFQNGSDHLIRKLISWRIEGTTQSSFWLVQIGHLLFSSFLSRWLPCGREPSTKHRITFF